MRVNLVNVLLRYIGCAGASLSPSSPNDDGRERQNMPWPTAWREATKRRVQW